MTAGTRPGSDRQAAEATTKQRSKGWLPPVDNAGEANQSDSGCGCIHHQITQSSAAYRGVWES